VFVKFVPFVRFRFDRWSPYNQTEESLADFLDGSLPGVFE
jgi:hypothetical protein